MSGCLDENAKLQMRCKFIAHASVFGSTVRGQGCGSISELRRRISEINIFSLKEFDNDNDFKLWLDSRTNELSSSFDKVNGKPNWGAPRKVLNIYMFALSRDYLLRSELKMEIIESFLEVPLDNKMADFIFCNANENERKTLGSKHTFRIKSLTSARSNTFQKSAEGIAERKGLKRVELDFISWTG